MKFFVCMSYVDYGGYKDQQTKYITLITQGLFPLI